jgi:serine/threonine protein kinase
MFSKKCFQATVGLLSVLFVLKQDLFAGTNIPIELEFQKTQALQNPSSPSAHEFLGRYRRVLDLHRLRTQTKGTGSSAPTIDSDMADRLKAHLAKFDELSQSDLDEQGIYLLVDCVESHLQQWRKNTGLVRTCPVPGPYHRNRDAIFFVPDQTNVFVILKHHRLGRGAHKVVDQVWSYRDTEYVARVHPKHGYFKKFERELEFLKRIGQLPDSERKGLAEVITFNSRNLFLKKYDLNLFPMLLEEDPKTAFVKKLPDGVSKLPFKERLSIAVQLSNGLYGLHRLGISHNDPKPENVLLNCSENNGTWEKCTAAYTDFSLSYLPTESYWSRLRKPTGGTPLYSSPEVTEGWTGGNSIDSIANALKGDIFSHSEIMFYLLEEGDLTWLKGECPSSFNVNTIVGYQNCKYFEAQRRADDYKRSLFYRSYTHLIQIGLQAEPMNRINSTQYLRAMKYIQKKYTTAPQSSAERVKQLESIKLMDPVALVGEPAGSYLVHKVYTVLGPLTVLYYVDAFTADGVKVDKGGQIIKKVLDIDLDDLEMLENEIRFLKDVGTIKKSIF